MNVATRNLDLGELTEDKAVQSELMLLSINHFRNLNQERFSSYSKIYPLTTENLTGYMPQLDLQGKSVLTVGGSGDQIINACLLGAKQVTAFDINILSALFSDLKLTALADMSHEEFKRFLLKEDGKNFNVLDFKKYESLREKIHAQSKLFFDNAFHWYRNSGWFLRSSDIFYQVYDDDALKIRSNPYLLSEEAFESAKQRVSDARVSWLNCAAENLETKLGNEKFDVILLSNIADYSRKIFPGQSSYLESYTKRIINPLKRNLTKRGVICAAYIYDARTEKTEDDEFRSHIDDPELRRSVFAGAKMRFDELYFDSVIENRKDAVVLLQK